MNWIFISIRDLKLKPQKCRRRTLSMKSHFRAAVDGVGEDGFVGVFDLGSGGKAAGEAGDGGFGGDGGDFLLKVGVEVPSLFHGGVWWRG